MAFLRARIRPTLWLCILQAAVLIVASACGVASQNPVASLAESEPIPEYLLGSWEFVELVGLDAEGREGGVVFDQDTDGTLRILITERDNTVERSASVATVGDLTILSMKPQEGEDRWLLASLAFDEVAETLTVKLLGHAEVTDDITLNIVEGEVFEFDEDQLARLNASQVQLRAYIAAHPDAFSDRIAILRRRTP